MIFIHLASWIIIILLGYKLINQFKKSFGKLAYWGMLAKVLGVLLLALTYLYYYRDGDTLTLLRQIKEFNLNQGTSFSNYFSALFAPIDPFSGNPRTVFFIRLMSPFGILTGHQYFLISIPLLLFSYWTTWSFLTKTVPHYPKAKNLWVLCIGFLPTYLFWSSGLLKDTLANGCLMFLTGLLIEFYHRRELKLADAIIGVLLFYLLFMTRHYLAGIWSIFATIILLDRWSFKYGKSVRLIVFSIITVIGAYGIRFFFIRLRPERFPITFHELHEQIVAKSTPDGSIITFDLQPTWFSFIMNLPKSLWTGLFRPGLWEAGSVLQLLESIQTTFLLIGFFLSGILVRKLRQLPLLVFPMVFFIIVLATLLPLATPNFGSLSRYRVAFTPFLAFLLFYLPYRQFVRKDL